MARHEELTSMIARVQHMADTGMQKASISSSLNIILSLRIPMQHCAVSATTGKVVCTMGTGFLLEHLRREKRLLEH